jgi:hypothetical protein
MYHLAQAVSLHQNNAPYKLDLHPLMMPWAFSFAVPWMGEFKDIHAFSSNPDDFISLFQYRMDKMSNLQEDEVMQRFRYFAQAFYVILLLSVFFAMRFWNFSSHKIFFVLSVLALEPWILGLSSLMLNDLVVLSFLALATTLSLYGNPLLLFLSLLSFAAAWSTKFSASLWLVSLTCGIYLGFLKWRSLYLWALGLPLGLFWAQYLGYDFSSISKPNFRTTYVDGLLTNRTDLVYFVQGFLNKSSLAVLVILILLGIYFYKQRAQLKSGLIVGTLFIFSLALASLILPGIGFRLAIPIAIPFIFVLASGLKLEKNKTYALVILLCIEALFNRHQLIAYQNPLAGSVPRLLDSNTDWGQGLKGLAEWRRKNPQGDLALSLFGGAMPEMYGLTAYEALPSEPRLPKQMMTSKSFSGFVAVSRNFLYGYIIHNPSLLYFKNKKPIECFENALCVYDMRAAP